MALPLLKRGLEIHGVDAAEAMVTQLRAKPGGDKIPVTIGDFSEVPVEGTFSMVFLASGTFFELPSPEAQLRRFHNVARTIRSGRPVRVRLADAGRLAKRQQPGDADRADARRPAHPAVSAVLSARATLHL